MPRAHRRVRNRLRWEFRRPGWALALAAWMLVLPGPRWGPDLPLPTVTTVWADEELDFGLQERRLRELEFVGNRFFTDDRLKRLIELRQPPWYAPFRVPTYRRDRVEQGVLAIRVLYRRQGFHRAEVQLQEVERDDVRGDHLRIVIEEGPRTLIDRLVFDGVEPLSPDDLEPLLRYHANGPAPARRADLGGDLYRVLNAYVSRGHLGARVRADLQTTDATLTLRYRIRSGPVYRVRRIDVEGARRVREPHIRRELRLEPGEIFDSAAIARTEAALLDTGWFRDVSFAPAELDTARAEAVLELKVVERPTRFLEFGVGTGSKDRLRLTTAWGDRNLWRSGRSLTARGRLLGVIDDKVNEPSTNAFYLDHEEELLYRHPYLFGSRFTINSSLFFRAESRPRTALELRRLGLLANTALFTSRYTRLEVEAAIERTIKDPLVEDVSFDNSRAQTRSLTMVLERDTRDDLFRPTRGELRQLLLQMAGGPALGGDNSFYKALTSFVRLQPLPGHNVLALRAQAGWAEASWHSLDRDGPTRGVPIENRFFAGGSNTVRGYRENSLGPRLRQTEIAVQDPRFLLDRLSAGGNALLLLNAELRLRLPLLSALGFDGVVFFDSGNVWASWGDVSVDQFRLSGDVEGSEAEVAYRTSWGVGLQYRTLVGPLRVEYGVPLRRARFFETLDDGTRSAVDTDPSHVWHISLGHAF